MLLPQSACAGIGLSMELKAATPPARAKARSARATRAWSRYFVMADALETRGSAAGATAIDVRWDRLFDGAECHEATSDGE